MPFGRATPALSLERWCKVDASREGPLGYVIMRLS